MAQNHNTPTSAEWDDARAHSPDDFDFEGADPMTDDQSTRLKALCWRLGEHFDKTLNRVEADHRIAELERRG